MQHYNGLDTYNGTSFSATVPPPVLNKNDCMDIHMPC